MSEYSPFWVPPCPILSLVVLFLTFGVVRWEVYLSETVLPLCWDPVDETKEFKKVAMGFIIRGLTSDFAPDRVHAVSLHKNAIGPNHRCAGDCMSKCRPIGPCPEINEIHLRTVSFVDDKNVGLLKSILAKGAFLTE
jgi:hypothetical protein